MRVEYGVDLFEYIFCECNGLLFIGNVFPSEIVGLKVLWKLQREVHIINCCE